MSLSQDALKVINEALAMIGQPAVFDLLGDTKREARLARLYPTIVGACFEAHRWTWARRTVKLDRLDVTPATPYAYAYAMPGDRSGNPLRLWPDRRNPDAPLRRFTLEGGEVHTDEAELYGTFIRQVEPTYWPALFRLAVVTGLAAAFAVPETHDVDLKNNLWRDAFGTPSEEMRGGILARALHRDLAGDPGPAPLMAADPLTSARDDGPWHGGASL